MNDNYLDVLTHNILNDVKNKVKYNYVFLEEKKEKENRFKNIF